MSGAELVPVNWRSRVEKTGTAHGLDYAVLVLAMGHRCGYVRVPEDHPWFGLRYWDGADGHVQPIKQEPPFAGTVDYEHPDARWEGRIEVVLDVHGGITFDGDRPNKSLEKGWWFGFDCAHSWDAKDPDLMSAEHRAIHERRDLDFEDPRASVRSRAYVEAECVKLAQQLAEAAVPEAEIVDAEPAPDQRDGAR